MKENLEYDVLNQITEKYKLEQQEPYYRDKEAGKVDELRQRQFKKATYDYLSAQKEILPEGQELTNVERKLKLLDNGWNAEDLPFMDSVFHVMNTINNNKSKIPPADVERHNEEFKDFMNEHIDKHIDRRRLINMLRYMYKTYEKINPEENKAQTQILETTIKNKSVDIIHLNPDENDRSKLVNLLSDNLTGLNAQHRGGLIKHEDTKEMDLFKQKVIELTGLLNMARDKNIYEDPRFRELCEEVQKLGNKYIEEKRKEAKSKIDAKTKELLAKKEEELKKKYDIENEKDPQKRRELINKMARERRVYTEEITEKAKKKLAEWRPSTKMGKTRFDSALAIVEATGRMASQMKSKKNFRAEISEIEKDMKESGFEVTRMENEELMIRRPYERGLNCITNYYGTHPKFISDHCARKGKSGMYTADEFKTIFKPVDVKEVTSDEFAAISYAAVMNPDNINEKEAQNHWKYKAPDITKEDALHHGRTMFSLDMGAHNGKPRENMAHDFLSWTLVPAKEKAKEALEAYNNGDKTKLAEMLAIGIKETQYECEKERYITRSEGLNFAFSSSMLEKMVKFTDKDPELKQMVEQQVGKDKMLAVQDTLRLKGFMDDCYDAERKLQKAADEGVSLSKQEKQACIDAIVKYEFLSTIHDKNRTEQVDDDLELQEFLKPENDEKTANYEKYGLGPHDMSIRESRIRHKAARPIKLVGKDLRTKEGMDRLNESVKKASKGLDPSSSEKDLLKNIKKCTDGLHQTAKNMRERDLKRREEYDKQRAEFEKQAQQKNVNKNGNTKNKEAGKSMGLN